MPTGAPLHISGGDEKKKKIFDVPPLKKKNLTLGGSPFLVALPHPFAVRVQRLGKNTGIHTSAVQTPMGKIYI